MASFVLAAAVSSARCGGRRLAALLHFVAPAHGLHLVHDVRERLLHGLLQDPALALALRVLRVGQRGQGAVHVLQADGHPKLQGTGGRVSGQGEPLGNHHVAF